MAIPYLEVSTTTAKALEPTFFLIKFWGEPATYLTAIGLVIFGVVGRIAGWWQWLWARAFPKSGAGVTPIHQEGGASFYRLSDLRNGPVERRTRKNGLRYDISKKLGVVGGPFCPECDTKVTIEWDNSYVVGIGGQKHTWSCPGCDAGGDYRKP